MTSRYDVAVVGAGIVGLASAYAAVRRGLSVVVIDRTASAVGATIRNFGHLCIGAQTGVARVYADASRDLWLTLSGEADFWLRESGTLVLARHDDEMALLDAAADDGGIRLLDAHEIVERAPVDPAVALGGAWIEPDLQTNPRTAAAAIAAYLERLGVEFRWRTSVGSVSSNVVRTTRGDVAAGTVIVAVNHDIDQLLPDLAERAGVVRCTLDMLRAHIDLRQPLAAPLLTGWSLARYGRFAVLPESQALIARLHAEQPELAAWDLNQMYTQLPDGTLLIGDTHHREVSPPPFQPEAGAEMLLEEAATLFGAPRPRVLERWQGVYASAPDDFLVAEAEAGVHVLAATTGIGMTTGLGLAEIELGAALDKQASTRSAGARRDRHLLAPSLKGSS